MYYSIKAIRNQCEALYIPSWNDGLRPYCINSAKNCISSKRSFVYHQADRNTHLRCDEIQRRLAAFDDIQPTADDIPSLSAWIKKSSFQRTRIFCLIYHKRRTTLFYIKIDGSNLGDYIFEHFFVIRYNISALTYAY